MSTVGFLVAYYLGGSFAQCLQLFLFVCESEFRKEVSMDIPVLPVPLVYDVLVEVPETEETRATGVTDVLPYTTRVESDRWQICPRA
jgi:hypothetical protein